jgi:hypothetical protein
MPTGFPMMPTVEPSIGPSQFPSAHPVLAPGLSPFSVPSARPSRSPVVSPTLFASRPPTGVPVTTTFSPIPMTTLSRGPGSPPFLNELTISLAGIFGFLVLVFCGMCFYCCYSGRRNARVRESPNIELANLRSQHHLVPLTEDQDDSGSSDLTESESEFDDDDDDEEKRDKPRPTVFGARKSLSHNEKKDSVEDNEEGNRTNLTDGSYGNARYQPIERDLEDDDDDLDDYSAGDNRYRWKNSMPFDPADDPGISEFESENEGKHTPQEHSSTSLSNQFGSNQPSKVNAPAPSNGNGSISSEESNAQSIDNSIKYDNLDEITFQNGIAGRIGTPQSSGTDNGTSQTDGNSDRKDDHKSDSDDDEGDESSISGLSKVSQKLNNRNDSD